MGILAPSFVILILPELWKNRSNGAMEVEGATFFSIKNIYAARMLLFGMVDVCLLSVFLITSTFVVTDCIYGYLNTIYFANECDIAAYVFDYFAVRR